MLENNTTLHGVSELDVAAPYHPIRILLVGGNQLDHDATLKLLKQTYKKSLELIWASNTERLNHLLNAETFDICLVNDQLSQTNGIELLAQVKKQRHSNMTTILLPWINTEIDKKAALPDVSDYPIKNNFESELLEHSIGYSLRQKDNERLVTYLLRHDILTGLANRSIFGDAVDQAIATCARHNAYAAVLLIDLDNFKPINDTLGYAIGDQLLVKIADRLQLGVRQEDTIARLGSDEFLLLLTQLDKDQSIAYEQVTTIAKKINRTMNQPLLTEGHEIKISASIGASLFNKNSTDSESLLRQADIAMYQAKRYGKDRICFFEPEMEAVTTSSYWMEQDLKDAISLGQLELYYQPIIDNMTKRIHGAEALIRWNHPQQGLILPNDFIPKAEKSDLICAIGLFVFEQACLYLQTNPAIEYLSINIGKRHLENNLFVDDIKKILTKTGIKPHRLIIELTENMFLENTSTSCNKIKSLRNIGLKFALDDFGTGYSSLSILKDLPFDILKINSAFTSTIGEEPNSETITLAIIAMAHALDMLVIVEGVEKSKQVNFMMKHGCYGSQGYYFSRPVPQKEFDQMLIKQ